MWVQVASQGTELEPISAWDSMTDGTRRNTLTVNYTTGSVSKYPWSAARTWLHMGQEWCDSLLCDSWRKSNSEHGVFWWEPLPDASGIVSPSGLPLIALLNGALALNPYFDNITMPVVFPPDSSVAWRCSTSGI